MLTTTTEKSPREIAKLFLDEWHIYASPLDAIELLIKARDERAALIAERDSMIDWRNGTLGDAKATALRIASAIRRTNQ